MYNYFKQKTFLLCLALVVPGVFPIQAAADYKPSRKIPPKPAREFRAAWVATVGNIDWPSKPGLSTARQKAELIAILDEAAKLKLNAIIFQVRTTCDAFYASPFEPWSEYLTGRMGQAPEPFYDPLAFAIEEAHKRGLELHAWFNPYRASHPLGKSSIAANHISKTKPQWTRKYGSYLWLDPGEPEVQDYVLKVVLDVVKRYDIDGVHFDDYFYPYPEKDASGKDLEFPDEVTYKKYGEPKKLSLDDWRRANVNALVERAYNSIKALKPWVRFGVSPFGIWRPGNPPQIKGFDAYAKLYADSRKWFASGWVDYLAPQLYWAIEPREQSFPVLLQWWAAQNTHNRDLFAGLNTTAAGSKWKPEEIIRQIQITRRQPGVSGHIHWSMSGLTRNSALTEMLRRDIYTQTALAPPLPASLWADAKPPAKPVLTASSGGSNSSTKITWQAAEKENVHFWVLQTEIHSRWTTEILSAETTSHVFNGDLPDTIAVSVLSHSDVMGEPAVIARSK